MVFRSVGRDTSASLSLEDSKASELELVKLRSLKVQEAQAGRRYGQSGFYSVNLCFKAKKVSSAAVAPKMICGRRYKLSSQKGSAAVLDCSGSECSRLSLYIYQVFLCYYHHWILVLTWCFLGCSFLFSSMYEFSTICLLNAIACNFPGWKKCNGTSAGWNRP